MPFVGSCEVDRRDERDLNSTLKILHETRPVRQLEVLQLHWCDGCLV